MTTKMQLQGLGGRELAGAQENVVIRVGGKAGDCAVTLMPAMGGKIASIRVGAEELLQTPLNPYGPRTKTMGFAEGDASGWDECLPSVSECSVETEVGTAHVPDHGDLWRVPWQVLGVSEDSATMRANCFSLPLQITRSAILTATKSGYKLELLYSLTNMGAYTVPWSWAAHPLFTALAGDRIVLPERVHELRLEGSGGNRLGVGGDTVGWPVANLKDGTTADLSVALGAETGIGDKLFAGPFTEAKDGWCALERPSAELKLTVRFDPKLTPYLGLWICYGGWPDGDGLKQVCVAIEPTTAPVDSLAIAGKWSLALEAGETFTWPMTLEIESVPRPS